MDFKAKVVVLGAGTLDSTRILLNSKSRAASERPRQLVRAPRLLPAANTRWASAAAASCRCASAPSPTLDDGRPVGALHPALPQRHGQAIPTSSAATTSRAAAAAGEYPGMAQRHCRASARRSSRRVRKYYPSMIGFTGFGEVLPAQGEPHPARPRGEGRLGPPGAALRVQVRRQREEDGQGHGRQHRGDAEGWPAPRTSRCGRDLPPGAGPSTRSGPRAWAKIPRQSVTDKLLPPARRHERLLRRRRAVRLRRHAEHDLVDPRDVLADDGLPERGDAGQ